MSLMRAHSGAALCCLGCICLGYSACQGCRIMQAVASTAGRVQIATSCKRPVGPRSSLPRAPVRRSSTIQAVAAPLAPTRTPPTQFEVGVGPFGECAPGPGRLVEWCSERLGNAMGQFCGALGLGRQAPPACATQIGRAHV